MKRDVTVIGAGAVGLTAAIALLERGYRANVVAESVKDTDSAVAAALWAVPFVEQSERTRTWAYETLARVRKDATPDAGVREQLCRIVGLALSSGDPWTRGFTPPIRVAEPHELPHGFRAGTISSIPLVDTGRYLGVLRESLLSLGGSIELRRVGAIQEIADEGAVIVNAAGFAAAALAGDSSIRAIRSQIVRVANPGLRMTTIVREGPLAPLFIVPRFDDVVIGGPVDHGRYDPHPDPALEEELLLRARLIEPALGGVAVLSRAVGHRPVRDTVRVEADVIDGCRVIHCYGHGGAGVALSWGTAGAVADLVESIL